MTKWTGQQGKRRDERPPPVSPEEWLDCGAALAAIAKPEAAPEESFWEACVADSTQGRRGPIVRRILAHAKLNHAVAVCARWARLASSNLLRHAVTPRESDSRRALLHLAYSIAPKPYRLRTAEGSLDRVYPVSWSSRCGSAEALAANWRRSTGLPVRRNATSPFGIVSAPGLTEEEERGDANGAMTDPCWLAGLAFDSLCREWTPSADDDVLVLKEEPRSVEHFQCSFMQALAPFVAQLITNRIGVPFVRRWFGGSVVDATHDFFSHYGSRGWSEATAGLAKPLGLAALPTFVCDVFLDFRKRTQLEQGAHPRQSQRVQVQYLQPDALEVAIHGPDSPADDEEQR